MIYIVYLTVNTVNKKIYVGVHQQIDNEFDGYIGCGRYEGNTSKSETPFQRSVNKYGYDKFIRTTLASFNTPEEAYRLEAEIVNDKFLSRKDVYNISPGGLCGIGGKNAKKLLQYTLSGKFVKVWESSMDVVRYFTGNTKSRALPLVVDKIDKSCYGYQWRSFEEDYKLVISPISLRNYKAPVARYDLQGNLIDVWNSCDNAAIKLLGKSTGQALKVAANKRIPYQGFLWVILLDGKESALKKITEWVNPEIVVGLNNNNQLIIEFSNIHEAKIAGYTNVAACLKGKRKTSNKLKWMYKVDYISCMI